MPHCLARTITSMSVSRNKGALIGRTWLKEIKLCVKTPPDRLKPHKGCFGALISYIRRGHLRGWPQVFCEVYCDLAHSYSCSLSDATEQLWPVIVSARLEPNVSPEDVGSDFHAAQERTIGNYPFGARSRQGLKSDACRNSIFPRPQSSGTGWLYTQTPSA